MKLLLCFLLLTMLNVSGSIFSQSATFDLAVSDKTVKEVFKDIENQSQFRFLYNDEFYGLDRRVSFNASSKSIDELLNDLLSGADLTYRELENNLIVITPNEFFYQQDHQVTGVVTDPAGESLPGVNVMVQGTAIGIVTDPDGRYSLQVPDPASVLEFSYVGYIRQVISVESRSVVDVVLLPDVLALDEVVVVGYGTQRAGNITGSISRVQTEELEKLTTPTVAQSLQGLTSGVFIKNANAQPGQNKTSINIRGFGTPLIIVDGNPVTQEYFNEMDPADIDQLNVLKDAAAAAIYGARAGNGVILVQTKRGRQSAPEFNFKTEATMQYLLRTAMPTMVDSWEVMAMWNFAFENEGRAAPFSREQVDLHKQYADGSNPDYPNDDPYALTYSKYSPLFQNALSVRGGTETVQYYLSGSWLNQSGMERSGDTRFDRYSLRSNIDVNLSDKLDMGLDFAYGVRDFIGPRNSMEAQGWNDGQSHFIRARRWRPYWSMDPFPNPDFPRGAPGGVTINPINATMIDIVGYQKWVSQNSNMKLNFGYDLPFNFRTRVVFNYQRDDYTRDVYTKQGREYNYNPDTGEYTHVRNINSRNRLDKRSQIDNRYNLQYFLEWNGQFANDHRLDAVLVAEYLSYDMAMFDAWRLGYEVDVDQLFAGPEDSQFNNSTALEGGRIGYIGRLSYNYAGKYVFETSARVDGSPLFPEDKRWGFFPSVSASWLLSEEDFIRDNLAFVSGLRLRASYGRLGYDAAGAFQYLATYGVSGRYNPYGNVIQSGLRADAIPNPNITWETMDIANIALEFTLFRGALGGSIDVFQRDRQNILGTRLRDLPDVVGAVMPQENFREFRNRGIELMLNHRQQLEDIRYQVGVNVSYNQQEIMFTDEPLFVNKEQERRNKQTGRLTGFQWKYPTDGLFKTQEEIDNWADIDGRNNASIQPGDVKWVDTNGDGRITPEDMIIAGHGFMPRFNYGFNTSFGWKSFDMSMIWQGAGLFGFNFAAGETYNWTHSSSSPMHFHKDHYYWPEDNGWMPANTDARFPIARSGWMGGAGRSYQGSLQHWWINGRYLRLRQLQLAYTLPSESLNRVGVDRLRIFVSGYNLLTFSELDFIDPEIDTSPTHMFHSYHPQMGSYHFGIEINF